MSSGHWIWRKWIKRTSWALLSVFLVATLIGCSSLKEHMAMKDGAKAYKAGKYAEAAKDYKQALKINPDRVDNWKYLAFCYWSLIEPGSTQPQDQQYTDEALNAFQKYLSIVGKDDQVQDYIINLYINQNRLADGIKYYESLLKQSPDDTRILQTLATMYGKEGNFQKSLEYSKKKAELTPNDPQGYLFIGALCWQRSYNKEDPNDVRAKIVQDGMDALEKAIQIEPNSFTGHLYMNLLYRQKADLAKDAAQEAKTRKDKKDLLAQADEYLQMANQERDKALAIKNGGKKAPAPAVPASGEVPPATTQN